MTIPWRQFEEAVYRIAEALDPGAEVIPNHFVPDRDTGTPRQCDVWIKAKYGGHWPITILVSCKDWGTPLDIHDIESFVAEIRSRGASTGVIYSSYGFTQPAVTKATANGIACCRLYRNEPADVPGVLWLDHFACTPRFLILPGNFIPELAMASWNHILDLRIHSDDRGCTVVDALAAVCQNLERQSVEKECKPTRCAPQLYLRT